jgi:hypothetical protein
MFVSRLGLFHGHARMFQRLPGMFVSRLVFRFPVPFRDPVGMRGNIVQFRRPLVVLVVRSVVISSRHD